MAAENSPPRPGNGSAQSSLQHLLHEAQTQIHQRREGCESAIRKAPARSVLMAAAFGYFLPEMPLGPLLRGLVHAGLLLLRPAALFYGGSQVYQWLQEEGKAPRPGAGWEASPPRQGLA